MMKTALAKPLLEQDDSEEGGEAEEEEQPFRGTFLEAEQQAQRRSRSIERQPSKLLSP